MPDMNDINTALSHIDPADRNTWVKIGAALKTELGEDGFNTWDNWSQNADNYDAKAARSTWKSLKPGYVNIGTLFYHASQNGYKPSREVASAPRKPKINAETRKQIQAAAAAATQQENLRVKLLAQNIWSQSRKASPDHPYLQRKQITDQTCLTSVRLNQYKGQNNIIVPIFYNGEIVNLESIREDGSKKLLSNGQVKGAYGLIGDISKLENGLYFAEGYATAASIHAATRAPVIITINAGNISEVAKHLAHTIPHDTRVVFAADNDANATGFKKAVEAQKHLPNSRVLMPAFSMHATHQFMQTHDGKLPSDFNDLHVISGLDEVRNQFSQLNVEHSTPKSEIDYPEGVTYTNEIPDYSPESMGFSADSSDGKSATTESTIHTTLKNTGSTRTSASQETASQDQPVNTIEHVQEQSAEAAPIKHDSWRPSRLLQFMHPHPPHPMPDEIDKHYFRIGDNNYHHKKKPEVCAFIDKGNQLKTDLNSSIVVGSLITIAESRGWNAIKVTGNAEFKRSVWIEASLRGMNVHGYKPSEIDHAMLEGRRKEKENRTNNASRNEKSTASPESKSHKQLMAESFLNDKPKDAIAKYPELAGAYAGVEAMRRKIQSAGLPQAAEKAAMDKATEIAAHSISKGQIPKMQVVEEETTTTITTTIHETEETKELVR